MCKYVKIFDNNKKVNNPVKMDKRLQQAFYKRCCQLASIHMKMCSPSVVFREMPHCNTIIAHSPEWLR